MLIGNKGGYNMKAKIVVNELIVESKFSLDEIKKVARFRPNTLIYGDPEKREFEILVGPSPWIGVNCISFAEESNSNKAILRTALPKNIENKADYVAEEFALPLARLEEIEDKMADVLDSIDCLIEGTKSRISVEI